MTDNKKTRRRRRKPPGMLKHSSGQARVIVDGVAHFFGKWGTPGAHTRYAEVLKLWHNGGEIAPGRIRDVTDAPLQSIASLTVTYSDWIDNSRLYQKDGKPTTQRGIIRVALKELNQFAGATPAAKFTSRVLVAHRDVLRAREDDLTPQGVNRKIGLIKQVVAWAAERGLMPETNAAVIRAVQPLRAGPRTRRQPVPLEDLRKTLPLLKPVIADMARLQYLLACRPGEICSMRWCDIDVPEDRVAPWRYVVRGAKTEHHGHETVYFANERAKEVMRRHMRLPQSSFVFRTDRRQCFTTKDYTRALRKAAREAGVAEFTAHQIRHLSITTIANDPRGGQAAASAAANHRSRSMTDAYVHNDPSLAVSAVRILSLD